MVGADHSKLMECITRALIKTVTMLIKMSAQFLSADMASMSACPPQARAFSLRMECSKGSCFGQ